jgi:hypothetical protein
VNTRATYANRDKVKQKFIVNGNEEMDIERKLRHHLDLSKYQNFSITSVKKVKPHIHRLSMTLTPYKEQSEPVHIERNGQEHHVRTNQPSGSSTYAVGLAGLLVADDEPSAWRRLGAFLVSLGDPSPGTAKESPLFDGGILHCEEVGESDSTCLVEYANEFKESRFFHGGAPGLGQK